SDIEAVLGTAAGRRTAAEPVPAPSGTVAAADWATAHGPPAAERRVLRRRRGRRLDCTGRRGPTALRRERLGESTRGLGRPEVGCRRPNGQGARRVVALGANDHPRRGQIRPAGRHGPNGAVEAWGTS